MGVLSKFVDRMVVFIWNYFTNINWAGKEKKEYSNYIYYLGVVK